jgi:uncharacterized membrane protein
MTQTPLPVSESNEFPFLSDSETTMRTEAFSDGVFAIAITLLALEVRVPSGEAVEAAGGLLRALADQWPSYLAFTISFVTILIMWTNHHQMFRLFRRTDQNFRLLNGLLLLGTSLIPFSSALLAEYLREPEQVQVAAAVYAGVFALAATFWVLTWFYGARIGGLLEPEVPAAVERSLNRVYLISVTLYWASVLAAAISAALSIGMVGLLAVFYAFPRRAARA